MTALRWDKFRTQGVWQALPSTDRMLLCPDLDIRPIQPHTCAVINFPRSNAPASVSTWRVAMIYTSGSVLSGCG